jgi:hypothetical protein
MKSAMDNDTLPLAAVLEMIKVEWAISKLG